MPRIIGVDIPANKRIEYAIQYLYGIGPTLAKEILKKAKINPGLKASQLTDENISAITTLIQNDYVVEGDLRRMISDVFRRSTAIAVCVIGRVCRAEVSGPARTPVRERARSRRSERSETKRRDV